MIPDTWLISTEAEQKVRTVLDRSREVGRKFNALKSETSVS